MRYKTILVHCNDLRRSKDLLATATAIAEAHGAHIIGLNVLPSVSFVPAGVPSSADVVVLDHLRKACEAERPALATAFETAMHGREVTSEWRQADADKSTVRDVVLSHARAVDLVVVKQSDVGWLGSGQLDIADDLVIAGGRPVLIVPNATSALRWPPNVVVAWNGQREASRALFDALPLLQSAASVKIVQIDSPSERIPGHILPTAAIRDALLRHGVKYEATEFIRSEDSAGAALLDRTRRDETDLLVMGCYGRSRIREYIFGGATLHMLRHMTIPVLMSR
jgi:nucleotide-binding universal stress UspA family protein